MGPLLVIKKDNAGSTENTAKLSRGLPDRTLKGRESVLTVGMWPWKSETFNECVITPQPNAVAPKTDNAQVIERRKVVCLMTRRVGEHTPSRRGD